jgi:hypothetical protein
MAKMSAVERKEFFKKALKEQKHLLRERIKDMEDGDIVAALQVATVVRTLVHETGASKPLLKQLRSNYLDLKIFAPKMEGATAPPGASAVVFFNPVSAKITAPEGKVSLMTEFIPDTHEECSLGSWWSMRPCTVLPGVGAVSRREAILGLSNKEGGAHVDAEISEKYKNLLASKFFTFLINGQTVEGLNLSRLGAGRIGLELLKSLDANFPDF